MGLITSFFALFLSVILLQLSSGGVGPLDALSGIKLDFSTQQIGMLGSSHFIGFFIVRATVFVYHWQPVGQIARP